MRLILLIANYEDKMLSCFYKKYIGVDCPGCGMQRAFYYLIHGDFLASVKMFPALIPLAVMILFLIAHLIFKFKKGHTILLFLFILNSAIIVVNYIIKFLT